jgi:hypothetical protein
VSSRLAVDRYGRLVAVGTCVELQGLRWIVIDLFELGFTPPGRAPTAQERMSARPPYDPTSAKRARLRPEVPDELLAEEEAIRQAMVEQQRQPADLVNMAA